MIILLHFVAFFPSGRWPVSSSLRAVFLARSGLLSAFGYEELAGGNVWIAAVPPSVTPGMTLLRRCLFALQRG